MRHLMTYEGLFNFLKKKVERTDSDKDVINTCEDILLELSDIYSGYEFNINGYNVHKELGTLRLKYFPTKYKLNEIDIKIWRTIPNQGRINNQQRKEIFNKEIKPIYDRLNEYLKSQGFKIKDILKNDNQSDLPHQNPVLWMFVAVS